MSASPPASSSSSVVDSAKIKSWYKAFSKAANEQIQWARENILKRPIPLQNDPLGSQRNELEAFDRMVHALSTDIEKFVLVIEAFQAKEVAALAFISTCRVTEIEWGQSSTAMFETYGRHHAEAVRRALEIRESLTSIQTSVKKKLDLLQSVKKQFEQRDRMFLRAQEENKRWQRARDTGDAKLVERRRKAEVAEAEFVVVSEEMGRSYQSVLRHREGFLSNILLEFQAIQQSWYSDLGALFSQAPRVEQWSPIQRQTTTLESHVGSRGLSPSMTDSLSQDSNRPDSAIGITSSSKKWQSGLSVAADVAAYSSRSTLGASSLTASRKQIFSNGNPFNNPLAEDSLTSETGNSDLSEDGRLPQASISEAEAQRNYLGAKLRGDHVGAIKKPDHAGGAPRQDHVGGGTVIQSSGSSSQENHWALWDPYTLARGDNIDKNTLATQRAAVFPGDDLDTINIDIL